MQIKRMALPQADQISDQSRFRLIEAHAQAPDAAFPDQHPLAENAFDLAAHALRHIAGKEQFERVDIAINRNGSDGLAFAGQACYVIGHLRSSRLGGSSVMVPVSSWK